jgi:2-polyprenyl-6-methoxyphenol hydroxylase-like FAD-dependent oxidoreductase
METRQIIIIGGGLAGLTSAIHLSKIGLQVTVIEKMNFSNTRFVVNTFQMRYCLIYNGLAWMSRIKTDADFQDHILNHQRQDRSLQVAFGRIWRQPLCAR